MMFNAFSTVFQLYGGGQFYCGRDRTVVGFTTTYSRIYNYLCNRCLSSLMLWVRIPIRTRCTTLCLLLTIFSAIFSLNVIVIIFSGIWQRVKISQIPKSNLCHCFSIEFLWKCNRFCCFLRFWWSRNCLSEVCVAQYLVFYLILCRPLFVFFVW
jgi:hypothetical protein